MTVLDGEKIAKQVREKVSEEVEMMSVKPKLAAVLMGDDPASELYVKKKSEACDEVGIESEVINVDPSSSEKELLSIIDNLNHNRSVHGIIVQLPLPEHISENNVLESVSPLKDVDGFHPENKGLLAQGRPRFVPATPKGIQTLLVETGNFPDGKHVVILGVSNIVGNPLANLLGKEKQTANATVTMCHSVTKNVKDYSRRADILVSAVGIPKFISSDMVKEGSIVIDVGINRVGDKLLGDVDFEDVKDKVAGITPVPGGVGPMTVASLLENTVKAASIHSKDKE